MSSLTHNPTPTSGALTFNPTPVTLTAYPTVDVSLAPSLIGDLVADQRQERSIIYILVSVIGATLMIAFFFAHRYNLVKCQSRNTDGVNLPIDEGDTRQMPEVVYDSCIDAHDNCNTSNDNTCCEISADMTNIETTKTFLYDIKPSAPLASADICSAWPQDVGDNRLPVVEAAMVLVEPAHTLVVSLEDKTDFFNQLDNADKFLSQNAYYEYRRMLRSSGITSIHEFLLVDDEFYERAQKLLKIIPGKRFNDCFLR